MNYLDYYLIDYAVAADGGSIGLCFEKENLHDFWINIDHGICSENKGAIKITPEDSLPFDSLAVEKIIHFLSQAKSVVEGGDDILKDFISKIPSP